MKKIFKIAKIIDEYKVVINAGSNQGIKEYQRFLIYSLDGETIFDPDTGYSLGNLEVIKGTGIATFVHDNMSTIESDKYRKLTPIEKKLLSVSPLTPQVDTKKAEFNNPKVGDLVKPI